MSILLPAYHETATLARCVASIVGADYPPALLEVVILHEADDHETLAVIRGLPPWPNVRSLEVVDDGLPRGKPRALNQALADCRGEIVAVFDAEDLVDRRVFREAAAEFRLRGADAVQGVLDMMNCTDGWLNRQFRAEYAHWFRRYLPALAEARFPVPLGGTTNFILRSVLLELGGWDAANVTEDFDLGLRMFTADKRVLAGGEAVTRQRHERVFGDPLGAGGRRRIYRVALIPLITREESPRRFRSWVRQRTRWQRGKLQTLRKLARHPPRGARAKAHVFLTCAQPHAAFVNVVGVAAAAYTTWDGIEFRWSSRAVMLLNLAAVVGYMTFHGAGYLASTRGTGVRRRHLHAAVCALTLPLYWAMQWLADFRAMKQEYLGSKVFWEKTPHEGRHFGPAPGGAGSWEPGATAVPPAVEPPSR